MTRTVNRPRSSRLRLLRGAGEGSPGPGGVAAIGIDPAGSRASAAPSPRRLRLVQDAPRSILLAGGDAGRRDALQAELAARMPEGTHIQQAEATWQVLEHAPSSRLVMIAGELDGSPPESVIHLLGSRHPQLPVFALSAPVAG